MPISYNFKDKDGNVVELNTIDREVCKDFNLQYNDSTYSMIFMAITNIGDFATRDGQFKMEHFDSAIIRCNIDEDNRWKILKYVHGKYFYSSWR